MITTFDLKLKLTIVIVDLNATHGSSGRGAQGGRTHGGLEAVGGGAELYFSVCILGSQGIPYHFAIDMNRKHKVIMWGR